MNEKDEKETLKPSKSVRNWMKSKKHKNAILCSTQCRETCSISQIRHDATSYALRYAQIQTFIFTVYRFYHQTSLFSLIYQRFCLAARTNSAWSMFENHNKFLEKANHGTRRRQEP